MNIKCKIEADERLQEIISNPSAITLTIKVDDDTSIVFNVSEYEFVGNENDGEQSDNSIPGWDQDVEQDENAEDVEEIVEDTRPVSTIFSNNLAELHDNHTRRTPVDRLAATKVPNSKVERQYAIKTHEEIENNNDFVEKHAALKNPEIRRFISSKNDFFEAVEKSKSKKSNIDIDSITDIRKKAIAMEAKEMAESIGVPAYIVNEEYGSLMINDLGVSLLLNSPLDLSRFSAKRLASSSDLKNMIANNMIRFISPEEAVAIVANAIEPENVGSYDVFSSHTEAQKSLSHGEDDEPDIVDLSNNMNDDSTEQERLIAQTNHGQVTNLTQKGGIRKSTHGNSMQQRPQQRSQPSQQAARPSSSGKSGIKPISKKF